jgi:hypothetical protein
LVLLVACSGAVEERILEDPFLSSPSPSAPAQTDGDKEEPAPTVEDQQQPNDDGEDQEEPVDNDEGQQEPATPPEDDLDPPPVEPPPEPSCHGNGHDEDGDGIDDNCDNCPTYANSGQHDGDRDGLGNRCEWAGHGSTLTGMRVFEPFNSAPTAFVVDGGDWSMSDSSLLGEAAPFGGTVIYETETVGAFSAETIFYHNADPPEGGEHFVGLTFFASSPAGHSPAADRHLWACVYDESNRTLDLWVVTGRRARAVDWVEVDDNAPRLHSPRRLRVYFDGEDRLKCRLENEEGEGWWLDAGTALNWADSGNAGLTVFNDTAIFTSFAVYH